MATPDAGLGILLTLVPAAALGFSLYQYRINSLSSERQRMRERAIKAADEMAILRSDGDVSLALKLLDYGDVSIEVVDRSSGSKTQVNVNRQQFAQALDYHGKREKASGTQSTEDKFGPFEIRIRDIVDALLVYLERVDALIAAGVIDKAEFGDLFSYWLKLMAEQPLPQDSKLDHFDDVSRAALWNYIRKYEFIGVVRLFRRYDRAAVMNAASEDAFKPRAAAALLKP
ncbi:hypothetical protein ABIF38_008800 [Bradyrhizobium japonicum]|uniref:hypothetical protein n=1 Tax=Bradyrhizobium TaxID=374 RepID=UPI0004AEBA5D|nr:MULTISPECIES: hypothetical protein [Bradyrhizobium]MCP1728883.1 hypothetical protein [Bradyrhizobium elkanii]MCS3452319.1 hypothetical protein [Bradyrhizobium elkanii]MCS3565578.1 hypothetical protein [Bradyrhizobium elkanii]MCS3573008.1 hypothetical protein [Bradyrhizobium elkanii]MCS3594299.1 hypothetical protein [Bradyrhizobium elkanii]